MTPGRWPRENSLHLQTPGVRPPYLVGVVIPAVSCIPQPRGLEKKNKEIDFTCFRTVKTSGVPPQCSLEWSSLTPGGHIFCWSLCCIPAMYQPQQLCFQGWMQNICLTYGKMWLTVGTIYPGTPGPYSSLTWVPWHASLQQDGSEESPWYLVPPIFWSKFLGQIIFLW